MRTVAMKIYRFHELPAKVKERVLEKNRYINVEYQDWWDCTYEDAERAGIQITGFDDHFCYGHLIESASESIDKIIEDHGPDCETRKIAEKWKPLFMADKATRRLAGEEEWEHDNALFTERYVKDIFAAYRRILREEEEYLTSDEAIIQTIEANDYEFTEDGEIHG